MGEPPNGGSRLGEAFSIQRRVIYALFLRELKTRFGKHRLGYLWVFLEPVVHMLVLFAILGLIAKHTMPGIPFPVFLICGLVPYFMFINIALRSLNALEANLGLLSYRPVHPLDTLIARAGLECIISAVVLVVLLVILDLSGQSVQLSDIPELAAIWGVLVLFGLGIGIIFMVIGHEFPVSEKIIPLFMRPLYFMSAVMYPLTTIPAEYRGWVLWNPLVHALELLRHTVVPAYAVENVSLVYMTFSALVVLFAGLALYKAREPSLLRS
ncbi:ABC transporter permease [Burkholderia sp. Ac-20353]|uniref:ABC transporter permease n=1 Tax=Burkholderia sp. Ac-20353 TaxID=2703894 RepID=UPI00197C0021|nr:ABC transporter permease [Burkholderia sp. Ac-20353]MBN3789418.1 ABC transporter permease [Burkholderia sp. Ac-20353]